MLLLVIAQICVHAVAGPCKANDVRDQNYLYHWDIIYANIEHHQSTQIHVFWIPITASEICCTSRHNSRKKSESNTKKEKENWTNLNECAPKKKRKNAWSLLLSFISYTREEKKLREQKRAPNPFALWVCLCSHWFLRNVQRVLFVLIFFMGEIRFIENKNVLNNFQFFCKWPSIIASEFSFDKMLVFEHVIVIIASWTAQFNSAAQTNQKFIAAFLLLIEWFHCFFISLRFFGHFIIFRFLLFFVWFGLHRPSKFRKPSTVPPIDSSMGNSHRKRAIRCLVLLPLQACYLSKRNFLF